MPLKWFSCSTEVRIFLNRWLQATGFEFNGMEESLTTNFNGEAHLRGQTLNSSLSALSQGNQFPLSSEQLPIFDLGFL